MADDTRQSPQDPSVREDLSKEGLTVDPNRKAFSGDQWKDAKSKFRTGAAANVLAGGTQNTAGGKIPEVSIAAAFDGGLKMSDFTELPKRPCVRDSFLTGLGSGFALGGVRFIFRAGVFSACSWFVGSACIVSGVSYQYCLYRRQAEKEGMMRAVELLNRKETEKKARAAYREKQKEERRKLKDQDLDQHYAKLREGKAADARPWWKVW